MTAVAAAAKRPIRSTIPARLDRPGWSPFHTRMVCGLGAAWMLDGLQITMSSSVTGVLTQPTTLDMTSTHIQIGHTATSVLNERCRASIGAVTPALTAMANGLRVGDHLLERMGAPRQKAEHAVA
jgi:hypothetical protein